MRARWGKSQHAVTAALGIALTALAGSPRATGQVTDGGKPQSRAAGGRLREEMRQMIETARDAVFPALVNIHVVTVNYWNGKEHKGSAVGSGTIISQEGHVVTNQHVSRHGRKFKCTLADKQEISAELVGEDPLTDLAVLKLDLSELADPAAGLPMARFGDSSELQIGDHVLAMGSPFALSRSVTLGIVSNTERVFGAGRGGDDVEEMELERGQRTGLFTRWIQHDAAINPGNSGGPLVNLKGEVVGVNELGGTGMGFAIPSNLAKTVTAALIERGEVARSWIGLSFKPIKKTGFKEGVLVNSVVEGGPAASAGIQAGDVIVRIDGEPVTIRFIEEIPPLMERTANVPIGSAVQIVHRRGNETHETAVVTKKLQKDRGEEAALRAWGLAVEEITEKMARDRRFENRQGALIGSVRSGGPAQLAEPSFSYGDVIKSIDGRPIADMAALVAEYERIMELDPLPEYLLVEFDRRGKNHLTLLKPKPDKDEDPPREIRKAWIGVATQPVLEKLAKKLGHPDARGFRITRVYPRTRATESDLAVGDIVLALGGNKLKPRGMQDAGLFARKVRKLSIGDTTTLTVLRDGAETEVTVKLERSRRTPAEARRDRNRDFELTVRELTFFDRDERRWDEKIRGVLVEQVESAGWAGLGGIRSGDLIQRIDERTIKGLKSYRKALEAISEAQPERVVFVVLRGVQTRFQFVEPDWKPVLSDKENATKNEENQPDDKTE